MYLCDAKLYIQQLFIVISVPQSFRNHSDENTCRNMIHIFSGFIDNRKFKRAAFEK